MESEKDVFFFRHNYNTQDEEDILAMRMDYGWEGYGLYWGLLEKLAQAKDYKLQIKRLKAISFDMRADEAKVKQIIFAYNLLQFDEEFFWSKTLIENRSKMKKVSKLRSEIGRRGGIKSGLKRSKTKQLLGKGEAIGSKQNEANEANEPKERKEEGKEKKADKEKNINTKKEFLENVSLTDDEYLKLQTKYGMDFTQACIEQLSAFKMSNGKTYKSDYGAINTWVVRTVKETQLKEQRISKTGQKQTLGERNDEMVRTILRDKGISYFDEDDEPDRFQLQ